MQVYRGMDIGTAKPSSETRRRIPHALVDIADPADEVNVSTIQALGRQAIADAQEQGHPVIIAGGSGLHFRAIVDPLTFAAVPALLIGVAAVAGFAPALRASRVDPIQVLSAEG